DTDRIGTLLSWNVMEGIWYGSYLFGAAAVMLFLRPGLALYVLMLVPLTGTAAMFFQRKLTRLERSIRESNARITGNFNEGIAGAMTVKTLGIEESMDEEFLKETGEMRRQAVMNGHVKGMFLSLTSFSGFAALSLVLWQGGMLTEQGLMELGTLSVFMSYALGIMEPVRWVVKVISDVITVRVNIERLASLQETEPDVKDTPEVIEKYGDSFRPKKAAWEKVRGDVRFEDVTFRYPDGSENILEHFNLKIPAGTTVAIVGETGAGKSTLVNLACRFFEPTAGTILIDGKDYRERSQLWLHSNIGYVLQNPHLFSGSIKENIRYGRLDATDEQIEAAAKAVSADTVVEKLENGYDSDVGEGGDRLSTGEKQLISFARAVLADPAIFVLDEATSSIDTQTEQLIQNAIAHLLKGRTSFLIAHRLSTIRHADIILVVKDGKIIESGSHEDLLRKKGYYFSLYTKQFEKEASAQLLRS
ncbi:MAG TPA: ABC transporter ATP-binding protein, partial [Ruminococcaceae bacterium]|nr:ABC transporter ATP-binding protein [Oscillospiraceae bacterium]